MIASLLALFVLLSIPVTFFLNTRTPFKGNAAGEIVEQPYTIYGDGLATGWVNWSWDGTVDTAVTNPVFSGTNSLSYTNTQRWGGLYLHSDQGIMMTPQSLIRYTIKTKGEGQKYSMRITNTNDRDIGKTIPLSRLGGQPTSSDWKTYLVSVSAFSSRPVTVGGFIIQDETGKTGNTFYIDDITFTTVATVPVVSILPSVGTPTIRPTTGTSPTLRPSASPSPRAATTTPFPTGSTSNYPWHTNIVATTFWVGEIFDPSLPDGSQVCSTYDSKWAYHWSGVNKGTVPNNAAGCPGSPVGGCDGVPGTNKCATEKRTAANGYFPTSPAVTPLENPFYLDLPYDDLNDSTAFRERCQVIPWANDPGYAGHCTDQNFSYMKNRWVRIVGPNGNTCYGQIEDAGPSHGSLYHDKNYVFGSNNAQPVQGQFNNAGMDVSPALNGCLGFSELDGDGDKVNWQFVNEADVPAGPWKTIITRSQVTN